MMAAIMEPEGLQTGGLGQFAPRGTPALLVTLRVNMAVLTRGEQEMLRLRTAKRLGPLPKLHYGITGVIVHGDRTQARVRLAAAHVERLPHQVYILPVKVLEFDTPHGSA